MDKLCRAKINFLVICNKFIIKLWSEVIGSLNLDNSLIDFAFRCPNYIKIYKEKDKEFEH